MLLYSNWVTLATTSPIYFQPFFSYFLTLLLLTNFLPYCYIFSNLYLFLLPFHFLTTLNLNVTLPFISSSSFYFVSSYPYLLTVNFQFSFYTYFPKRLLLSLSLSKKFFFGGFFILYTSTLCWWNFVFFRILLWVDAIWFCFF